MKFNFLKTAALATMIVASLASCQDDFLDDGKSGKGAGAAVGTKTVGNGIEVYITKNTTWSKDTIYLLDGFVRFKGTFNNPITLTIEPGTIVKGLIGGAGKEPGTLVIEKQAKLVANGTPTQPIVFTSAQPEGSRQPGDWGGIIWLGRSYVNVKIGSKALNHYEAFIEGLPASVAPGFYGVAGQSNGGANYTYNNGSLTYARIEFAGNVLSEGNETNGLTMGGLGSGTTMHHVMVSYGSDDGFEWFGGGNDQKFLISYRNKDDDFDTDQGFWGRLQYGIVLRDPAIFGNGSGGSRGIEANGDDDDARNLNLDVLADPMYSQVTILGPNGPDGAACTQTFPAGTYGEGVIVRDQSQIDMFNSVVAGFPKFGVFWPIEGGVPRVNDFYNDRTKFQNNRVVAPFVAGAETTNTNQPNDFALKQNTIRYATACGPNNVNDVAAQAGLKRRAWFLPNVPADTKPDFSILNTSPLNTGAVYTNFRFTSVWRLQNPSFWDQVPFKNAMGTDVNGATGAVGPFSYGGSWFINDNWVNWTPNATAYN